MITIDLKVGETLRIGDVAMITMQQKSGQLARLTVDADSSVQIKKVQHHSPASIAASGGITGKA